jgi:hypothetical protein
VELTSHRFASQVQSGQVRIHFGDSAEVISAMADASLDWIYIDGDHRYDGVKPDLEPARRKIKQDRLIGLKLDFLWCLRCFRQAMTNLGAVASTVTVYAVK